MEESSGFYFHLLLNRFFSTIVSGLNERVFQVRKASGPFRIVPSGRKLMQITSARRKGCRASCSGLHGSAGHHEETKFLELP